MKTCRLCGESKPLDQFHKSSSAKDGRQSRCKPCAISAARQWAIDNPDRHKRNAARERQGEQYKNRRAAWVKDNADRIREQKRAEYQRNREQRRAQMKEYAARPEVKAAARERYARWRANNPRAVHARWIEKLYGITLADYDFMILQQEGRCAICERPDPRLDVDHCHNTSVVRGLLCSPCNRGIGCLGDDPERLIAAAAYIQAHKT